MRLRVLGILGTLLLAIVAIASAMLLQSVSRDATADLQLNRISALNRFVQLATHADLNSDMSLLQLEMDTYSDLYGEGLLINLGQRQLVSGSIDPQDPEVAQAVRNAELNLGLLQLPPIDPFSDATALLSQPFGNSAQVLGSVTMQVNLETARTKVLEKSSVLWLMVISLGAGLLLLADRLTSWVLRPVHRLNDAVNDIAQHQAPVHLEEQGPPELRQLSRSLSRMAQTMAESLDQQQQLIAETSHQLRNPVAALRLRVDLLKMRLGEQADPAGVHAVESELDRVETLLDGVMRLASAEHRLTEQRAGDALPDAAVRGQQIDVGQMLAEEVERQSEAARLLGNQLVLDASATSEPEAIAWCNGFDLQQMLAELVENAFKYAPGSSIVMGLELHQRTIEIQIQDHGPGMSAAEMENAADRFWRAEQVRHRPGTGLGLAIVDRLARVNAGGLTLESSPGQGLKATISLPRHTKESEVHDES
ncbi:sensor histidine kinase [Glutamicibacter nicotianae]|uniref:sensor histidine kinase n=1 Tax=Glutamicibacter nicotianae TaxID=37929 RepID=UPI0025569279|nr:HAMP domain-containing sensor histidine kinase [Glutamicibacter nicotianae]WIV45538.1 HAMP domain-containing sensor histidine kinase [Glutamicibacter nicotianae]